MTTNTATARTTSGRGWATTGAVLGGLVSVAANVAHSYIPPAGHTGIWHPEPGAVIISIVWPVFLFIAIEILVRIAWPRSIGPTLAKWAGLLPVALVAAFVSYRHLSGLLAHYGEEPIVTVLGPLAVDGLMIMATAAILVTSHRTTNTATEITSTTAENPTITTISAVPQLTTPAQPTPAPTVPTPIAEPTPVPVPDVRPVPTPAELATRITAPRTTTGPGPAPEPDPVPRPTRTRPSTPQATPALLAPSATDFSVTGPDAAQPALPIADTDLLARARDIVREHLAEHGTPPPASRLAARLHVPSVLAIDLLTQIKDEPNTTTRPVNGRRMQASAR
jgi:hypothetical protein